MQRGVTHDVAPASPKVHESRLSESVRPAGRPGQAAAPSTGRGGGRGAFGGQQAPPAYPTFGGTVPAEVGEYTIVVTAGGKTLSKTFQVIEDAWFDKMY